MGDSAETARHKIEVYFATFNWRIIGVEEAATIKKDYFYENDEFNEMIKRATTNSEAIICGTFHSYKLN